MKQKLVIFILTATLTNQTVLAQGLLGRLTDAVGSVVNTGVRVTTAPYEVLINTGRVVLTNDSPPAVYRPYIEVAREAGTGVVRLTDLYNDPQQFLFDRAQQFAQTGGVPGQFIFDVGTFAGQLYKDLKLSAAYNSGGILQGQNPLQLFATPLAAAIRAAQARHAANARPLPNDVKDALRDHFSEKTLSRAKYSVGNIQITLPNFIGQGTRLFGNDYAVVVDDIIVFNTAPPSYHDQPFWWAHELTHVRQYEELGLEGFAYNYATGWASLESEADTNASRITGNRSNIGISRLSVGSFDMTGVRSNIDYRQNPEYYIAQCVFHYDAYGVHYLLTNYGRIVAMDPSTGQWLHIGFATAPLAPGVAWSYQTTNFKYAVLPNGAICMTIPIYDSVCKVVGYNYTQIGHVIRFGGRAKSNVIIGGSRKH